MSKDLGFWVLAFMCRCFLVGVSLRGRIITKGNGDSTPGQVWLSGRNLFGGLCMCLTLINRYKIVIFLGCHYYP